MTSAANTEILGVIDRLIALPRPASEDVMDELGLAMTRQPRTKLFEEYEGMLERGTFGHVRLSHHLVRGTGMVNLTAREGVRVSETEIDMEHYGVRPAGTPWPHTPPEGTLTYIFKLHEGVREIWFSFHYLSRTLRLVSLRWAQRQTAQQA